MKKLLVLAGVVSVAVLTMSLVSSAQPGGGWGRGGGRGWGGAPCGRTGPVHFDSSSLETLKGKVVSLETVGGYGRWPMNTLKIETGGKTTSILLGPDFYLTAQKFSPKAGDEAVVLASKTVNRGDVTHIAKSVTVGGTTTALRDEAGFPTWRGAGASFGGRGRGGMRGGPGRGRGMMGPGGYGPANILPQSE
ncbi:MAG: hypothetical protein HOJ95_13880 [Nitrospinaceae bacterium]|nr:hypothetical protein [Nitrospinaceae bacterium]MBT5369517.1 hypothetical protein [Nitrospinaceae bacterium]MBT6395788.1 hypothetical protein [Nitrospinaceae bacterium]MBT7855827.1 hypothetical protein [Nitrospinaceae bacterium]